MKPHHLKSLKYLLLVSSLQKKCWPTPCSERIKKIFHSVVSQNSTHCWTQIKFSPVGLLLLGLEMLSYTQGGRKKGKKREREKWDMKEERTEEHHVGPSYPRNNLWDGDSVAGSLLGMDLSNTSQGVRGPSLRTGRRWIAMHSLQEMPTGLALELSWCQQGDINWPGHSIYLAVSYFSAGYPLGSDVRSSQVKILMCLPHMSWP